MKKATAIAAAMTCAGIAQANAEPAFMEPKLVELRPVTPGVKKALKQFNLLGQDLTFSAYGMNASADTRFFQTTYRDAMVMDKVMPGYPQPPRLTFEIRISL